MDPSQDAPSVWLSMAVGRSSTRIRRIGGNPYEEVRRMEPHRVQLREGEEIGGEPSSFRMAFSQARLESRSVGFEMISEKELEPDSVNVSSRYEVRIEKRSGKRSSDTARWNKLGSQGWELISVVGKQAFFRRSISTLLK